MQNKKVGFWIVLAHGKNPTFLFYRAKPASVIFEKITLHGSFPVVHNIKRSVHNKSI